jgi:hypothetical protein
MITVDGSAASVKFTDDGSTPTSTNGMTLVAGIAPFWYYGAVNKLKFILCAGTPTLNVLTYR